MGNNQSVNNQQGLRIHGPASCNVTRKCGLGLSLYVITSESTTSKTLWATDSLVQSKQWVKFVCNNQSVNNQQGLMGHCPALCSVSSGLSLCVITNQSVTSKALGVTDQPRAMSAGTVGWWQRGPGCCVNPPLTRPPAMPPALSPCVLNIINTSNDTCPKHHQHQQ